MNKELNYKIQKFYDASTPLWEEIWGEHMHHGYYGINGSKINEHYQAQLILIEKLLEWGAVSKVSRILDVGCGIGGSSLYLAKKFNAEVTGITLSPVQVERAKERAKAAGLNDRLHFEVADALSISFHRGLFDLIWALESAEHFSDKKRFLQRCAPQLKIGGKLIIATWCHRPIPPAISPKEQLFLNRLYSAYNLPYIISIEEYKALAREIGFEDIEIDDWTKEVAPFWSAVLSSAISYKSIKGLIKAGWPTLRAAISMNMLIKGYRSGLICFGILHARKTWDG